MQEEIKPAEPPPSQAPTVPTNGNKKHKTNEFTNLELILEGYIRSIDKIKQRFESKDGRIKEFKGFETTITFYDEKEKVDKKLTYPLFIDSDSINSSKIKIYKLPDGSYRICDVTKERVYE